MDIRNSYLSHYADCPRRYLLQAVDFTGCGEGLIAPPSKPMLVGSMVHAGLRDLYARINGKELPISYWDQEREEKRPVDEVLLESDRLLKAYERRYIKGEKDESWKVLVTELPVSFPILHKDVSVYYVGTTDALIRVTLSSANTETLWVVDHKTSAQLSSSIILHYVYSPQMQGYIGAIQEGIVEKISGICINLIVKTQVPNFHREYAVVNPMWFKQWRAATQQMIEGLVNRVIDVFVNNVDPFIAFPQNRYACVPYIGNECPFRLVCWFNNGKVSPGIRNTYIPNKDVVTHDDVVKIHGQLTHLLSSKPEVDTPPQPFVSHGDQ